ncbi:hypothetical protein TB2_034602 [Malus domestica]
MAEHDTSYTKWTAVRAAIVSAISADFTPRIRAAIAATNTPWSSRITAPIPPNSSIRATFYTLGAMLEFYNVYPLGSSLSRSTRRNFFPSICSKATLKLTQSFVWIKHSPFVPANFEGHLVLKLNGLENQIETERVNRAMNVQQFPSRLHTKQECQL